MLMQDFTGVPALADLAAMRETAHTTTGPDAPQIFFGRYDLRKRR